MKRILLHALIVLLALPCVVFADGTPSDEVTDCPSFQGWFANAINPDRATPIEEIDIGLLDECLDVQATLDNDYQGSQFDNKKLFLDVLDKSTLSVEEIRSIKAQFDFAFSDQDTDCGGMSCVNTIHFLKAKFSNEIYHVLYTGWGDDDFYAIYGFKADSDKPIFKTSW